MAAPRLLSRLERAVLGRTRSRAAHELADYPDARDFFRARQRSNQPHDPGRLIETAFLGAVPEDDAEALLIAWLTVLPEGVDAPAAAAHLARHLNQLLQRPPSRAQRRLLDLLAYVAAHKRTTSTPLTSDLKRKA